MIIIKPRDDEISKEEVYKISCYCGCEFVITDKEFTERERSINGDAWINCPECNHQLSRKANGLKMNWEEYATLLQNNDILNYKGKVVIVELSTRGIVNDVGIHIEDNIINSVYIRDACTNDYLKIVPETELRKMSFTGDLSSYRE